MEPHTNTTLQHVLGIASVFFVVLGVVAVLVMPVRRNMDARTAGDPMVSSHIFALIPLAIAVHHRMWLAAAVIASSTMASVVYHLARERPGSGLQLLDTVFAYLFAIFVGGLALLLAVSGASATTHTVPILVTGIFAGIIGTLLLWLPDMVSTKDPCYEGRVHPLWHMLAFASASLVIWAGAHAKSEMLMDGGLDAAKAIRERGVGKVLLAWMA